MASVKLVSTKRRFMPSWFTCFGDDSTAHDRPFSCWDRAEPARARGCVRPSAMPPISICSTKCDRGTERPGSPGTRVSWCAIPTASEWDRCLAVFGVCSQTTGWIALAIALAWIRRARGGLPTYLARILDGCPRSVLLFAQGPTRCPAGFSLLLRLVDSRFQCVSATNRPATRSSNAVS